MNLQGYMQGKGMIYIVNITAIYVFDLLPNIFFQTNIILDLPSLGKVLS